MLPRTGHSSFPVVRCMPTVSFRIFLELEFNADEVREEKAMVKGLLPEEAEVLDAEDLGAFALFRRARLAIFARAYGEEKGDLHCFGDGDRLWVL